MTFPKIELHVHLEGTVTPADLLAIARRNEVALPCADEAGLASLFQFRDFAHFLQVWVMATGALRTERDYREIVAGYAARAAAQGAVYIEGIFSPAEAVRRGASWDEVFTGFCDGAEQARRDHGVIVRLTPDVTRDLPARDAETTARFAAAYRERGVVGLGLGGSEQRFPPEPFRRAFQIARDAGLGSVPHAGESAGPGSVREAMEALGADRIRHGITAAGDPGLLAELAGRGIVLDVCPVSNVRTGVVRSLAEHPLPALVAAGVRCTVNTDDPAMFGTDLEREHAAARAMGVSARSCFDAGVAGALCDETTRARLAEIGASASWPADQVPVAGHGPAASAPQAG